MKLIIHFYCNYFVTLRVNDFWFGIDGLCLNDLGSVENFFRGVGVDEGGGVSAFGRRPVKRRVSTSYLHSPKILKYPLQLLPCIKAITR